VKVKPNRLPLLGRLPLLALGIVALVCGVWGGLIRLPLNLPLPANNANWITYHGPLMVCGFLGTVIALERAVGLRHGWTYLAPVLTGLGALALAGGMAGRIGPLLLTLGSALFLAVSCRVVRLQRALFTVTLSVAALTWLVGNLLWLYQWPFNRVVPWWMAFLGLTVIGERLELSRFQKPVPAARPLFLLALSLFLSGVLLSAFFDTAGEQLAGLGLLALAAWLARFDIARRTMKQPGLTRFMAVCLLGGYVWLAVAGLLLIRFAPLESGLRYDPVLHAFFLGFIFAMIFAHAPVIFPAVLQRPVAFSPRFYSHVLLLHLSLLLRVTGDLTGWAAGRQWGGSLNAIALALFLVNTVTAMLWPGATNTLKR
ncbi:MAG TPA: hypothetical protein VNZ22_10980, partial [Bacillota bacterium]|nr:hypothetical protein [Bacillota bacterium]